MLRYVLIPPGSCYEVEEGATGQERRKTRANASVKALDRGHVGCQISPVEMARIMGALLRMHQNELEMQVWFLSLFNSK